MEMNPQEGLQQLLAEFSIKEDSEKALKLKKYLALLEKWNARINLTAKTDWKFLAPLFREGIWAADRYSHEFRTHLDIGSGAGFPALILNIFFEHTSLEMVESRGKKSAFLETAAYELGLKNVKAKILRLDSMLAASSEKQPWDCISWKAIKLTTNDLLTLREHAHENTQFWMFHGKEYALQEPKALENHFVNIATYKIPQTEESSLSIYKIR
jgi:16S rRNA (guanine527-N7)-methyltransferase